MENSNNSNLEITEEIKRYLSDTAKWAQFLSIVGFVFVGFILLLAFFMKSIFEALQNSPEMGALPSNFGGVMGVVYVILAIIYFIPVLYQYQFATKMRAALNNNDNIDFKEAFLKLKSYYKFIGILTIIMIAIYVLFFIGMGAFGASSM